MKNRNIEIRTNWYLLTMNEEEQLYISTMSMIDANKWYGVVTRWIKEAKEWLCRDVSTSWSELYFRPWLEKRY